MRLTKEEVEHVARLARIKISESEKEIFSDQLSEILNYVGQLNKVDTTNVAATARVTEIINVMEEDCVRPCGLSREEILANAPEMQDGYLKVKAVLE